MNKLLEALRFAVRKAGFDVVRIAAKSDAAEMLQAYSGVRLLNSVKFKSDHEGMIADSFKSNIWKYSNISRSQIFQDIFVLSVLAERRSGYFVEFGATNGMDLSNTYLLEKNFGWNGIVCEPARLWHSDLKRNRGCAIDTRCVWTSSGKLLNFKEVEYPELSTIDHYSAKDSLAKSRSLGINYSVETVSLTDLLLQNSAPRHIDYLSIDTEGSELDIIEEFDFTQYSFDVITIEHNFGSNRSRIQEILRSAGYKRVLQELSIFDDWYLREAAQVCE